MLLQLTKGLKGMPRRGRAAGGGGWKDDAIDADVTPEFKAWIEKVLKNFTVGDEPRQRPHLDNYNYCLGHCGVVVSFWRERFLSCF